MGALPLAMASAAAVAVSLLGSAFVGIVVPATDLCPVVYINGLPSSTKVLFLSRLAVCTSTADSWSGGFSMALRPPAEAAFSCTQPPDMCCILVARCETYAGCVQV